MLADEINRTPPKTQAALLEAMQGTRRHLRRHHAFARQEFHGGGDAEPDRALRVSIPCPRLSSTASCSSTG
ncbi:AAA family ATPase [Mesorhizobium atlanticum]